MRKGLIPYAGYDSTESEFAYVDRSASSRNFELARSMRPQIDGRRALRIRNTIRPTCRMKNRPRGKLSWREVGELLAKEEGRAMAYTASALFYAIRRLNK